MDALNNRAISAKQTKGAYKMKTNYAENQEGKRITEGLKITWLKIKEDIKTSDLDEVDQALRIARDRLSDLMPYGDYKKLHIDVKELTSVLASALRSLTNDTAYVFIDPKS